MAKPAEEVVYRKFSILACEGCGTGFKRMHKVVLPHKLCPSCAAHARTLHTKYKITLAEYWRIFTAQGGKCAACQNPASRSPRGLLYVDHCHATGKIRGLLCHGCNSALGHAKDRINVLLGLVQYLRNHSNTMVRDTCCNENSPEARIFR